MNGPQSPGALLPKHLLLLQETKRWTSLWCLVGHFLCSYIFTYYLLWHPDCQKYFNWLLKSTSMLFLQHDIGGVHFMSWVLHKSRKEHVKFSEIFCRTAWGRSSKPCSMLTRVPPMTSQDPQPHPGFVLKRISCFTAKEIPRISNIYGIYETNRDSQRTRTHEWDTSYLTAWTKLD